MSDSEQLEGFTSLPAGGFSLGGLGPGDVDRTLGARDEADGQEPEGQPPAPLPGSTGQLGLPRRGLVALRKSGGLRFTTRGVVVYRSGWVLPLAGTEGHPRRMTPEDLAALEALVAQSGLGRRCLAQPGKTRDGYYYEITARYGGRTRYVEAADGAIPEQMERLIEILQLLLRGVSG